MQLPIYEAGQQRRVRNHLSFMSSREDLRPIFASAGWTPIFLMRGTNWVRSRINSQDSPNSVALTPRQQRMQYPE
jgi:hypothetical protein